MSLCFSSVRMTPEYGTSSRPNLFGPATSCKRLRDTFFSSMPIAPQTRSKQGIWLAIVLAFAALALTLVLISRAHPLPEALLRGTRGALVGAFLVYAFLRRSLMTWIFACMVIGGTFGHEFPQYAVKFQIVTQIFLRLIKAIIAPL